MNLSLPQINRIIFYCFLAGFFWSFLFVYFCPTFFFLLSFFLLLSWGFFFVQKNTHLLSFCLAILWGLLFGSSLFSFYQQDSLLALSWAQKYFVQEKIVATGSIEFFQKTTDRSNCFLFIPQSINGNIVDKSFKLLLYVPKNKYFEYGDIVQFSGIILENYSAKPWYTHQKIFAGMYTSNPQIISSSPSFFRSLWTYKKELLSGFDSFYSSEKKGLLYGIIFWEKTYLSPQIKDIFYKSGLSHLLVASGWNINILILISGLLFCFFPIIIRIPLQILCITLYVLFIGGDIPIIRAALMGSVLLFFNHQKNKSLQTIPLLFAVAFLLCLFSPLSFLFDPWFQLSFLSVLSILLFSSFFHRLFSFLPSILKETVSLSLWASILVLPFIYFYFNSFSLGFLPANIIASVLLSYILFFGILSLIFSSISFYGALLFATICSLFLNILILVAQFFSF